MRKKRAKSGLMNFDSLVRAILEVHQRMAGQAAKAVNVSLTLRNWTIGWYIREYEQQGTDRAKYGEALLDRLAEELKEDGLTELASRTLRQCRQFYSVYPQIWRTPSAKSLAGLLPSPNWQTLSAKSPVDKLLTTLSFSHLAELIAIDDPLKRAFYEIECIRGNWSVRELKRQIQSLYFERTGLSRNKKKVAIMAHSKAERATTALAVRDPYVFEFLGLKPKEVMGESHLEDSLLDRLQEFLLELGRGFCFEARQKRILIGGEHFFVDLVFYHRILKCHVLIELKLDGFKHEYLGQLNTYVNWYRVHEAAKGDNPPVGILLCTKKNKALVEYALAGMDNRLFVSKYQLELPKKEDILRFLEAQMEDR